ncbi:hypothetical protein ANCCAN_09843 [Ancylostoma caninum]|uniref:Guanylate cyclase domain-containing protein n=1 Tax=Ancylostoma caninum TaxID=29170 RepID=A0A368GME6_ANCCA|nr:hypothetical protein ANCCAN_09843 [Ancylostoma caninum]
MFQVETIGEAYMVVSGVSNFKATQFHAKEKGNKENFSMIWLIPHRPNEQLTLRIGIHTGSCLAGVMDKTMPRYCLFDDTVNTASRMSYAKC